jgi:hypothetical protein
MPKEQPSSGTIKEKHFFLISGTYLERHGCGANPKSCGFSQIASEALRNSNALCNLTSETEIVWCPFRLQS